ncbi:hypothetical protein ABW19_dt0206583 [Dactylella cylindrospora]|nr:hypothetical protein ABW19_dt0206583 [Dactylella cylindrospora]
MQVKLTTFFILILLGASDGFVARVSTDVANSLVSVRDSSNGDQKLPSVDLRHLFGRAGVSPPKSPTSPTSPSGSRGRGRSRGGAQRRRKGSSSHQSPYGRPKTRSQTKAEKGKAGADPLTVDTTRDPMDIDSEVVQSPSIVSPMERVSLGGVAGSSREPVTLGFGDIESGPGFANMKLGWPEMHKQYRLELQDLTGRNLPPNYFNDRIRLIDEVETPRLTLTNAIDSNQIRLYGRRALNDMNARSVDTPDRPDFDFNAAPSLYIIEGGPQRRGEAAGNGLAGQWNPSPPSWRLYDSHRTGILPAAKPPATRGGGDGDSESEGDGLSEYSDSEEAQFQFSPDYREGIVSSRYSVHKDPPRIGTQFQMARVFTSWRDRTVVISDIDKSYDPNINGLLVSGRQLEISDAVTAIVHRNLGGNANRMRNINFVQLESVRNAEARLVVDDVLNDLGRTKVELQYGAVVSIRLDTNPAQFEKMLGTRILRPILRAWGEHKQKFGDKAPDTIYLTYGKTSPYIGISFRDRTAGAA